MCSNIIFGASEKGWGGENERFIIILQFTIERGRSCRLITFKLGLFIIDSNRI
jgi:hypothetical protein